MKKRICMLLALTMLLSFGSAGVCAADTGGVQAENLAAGFYMETPKSASVTVTPVTEAEEKTIVKDETDYCYYPDAVKMDASCTATGGKQYLVMLVKGAVAAVPDEDNDILYINQIEATGTTVSFSGSDSVYPNLDGLSSGDELTLLVTSDDGTAMKKATIYYGGAGSYDVRQYTLGDVDDNGTVNASDALMALQIAGELIEPTSTQQLAANVDGVSGVNANDALAILQYAGGLITEW